MDAAFLVEDQTRINDYSLLNGRMAELRAQHAAQKKQIELFEDALNELEVILDEDEPIAFRTGEVFMQCHIDEVRAQLASLKKTAEEECSLLYDSINETDKRMTILKRLLYSKFGDSIQLEPNDS